MIKPGFRLLIFFMIMWNGNVLGQQGHIAEGKPSEKYESRLRELHQSAADLRRTDPEQSLVLCNRLYRLADSLNYLPAVTDALLLKIRLYIGLGKIDSALVLCGQAIHLGDSINDAAKLAEANYLEAAIYSMTRGPLETIDKFRSCYTRYSEVPDSAGMANSLNGIGISFYKMAIYDSALNNYLGALKIAEKLELTSILGKIYLNLGPLYDDMKKPGKAKSSYFKSIVYLEQGGSIVNLAKAFHNIGNICLDEKKYDSAWTMYNKGLELNLQVNYPEGIANAYIGLGDLSGRSGDRAKAKEQFEKAKHYYTIINNKEGICLSYINLGMNQKQMGNFAMAFKLYDSALVIAREMGFQKREAEIYSHISEAYAAKGDYQNAYVNLWKLLEKRDTILDIEKQNSINNLESIYQYEKKRSEILALKNDNLQKEVELERKTRQRNTYLFSGSGIVFVLVFLFAYYSQRTRKNQIIANQRITQLEEEKKLLAARSIVEGQEEERKRIAKELHDGLGVLLSSAKMHFTSIRDQSPEAQPMIDKATKLLEQATGDVRKISHNMMPGLLTKFGLYEAVEDLFEQVDEVEGIHAEVIIEGEQSRMKENTEIMLYRIIQELVNNTLKHAEAKNIDMHMIISTGKLEIIYSDDGKGYMPEQIKDAQSMGMQSIKSRISYLGGAYQLESAAGKGVRYVIEVPV